ncbi:MAG: hypothetical protein Q9207_007655, partial [Kuettlingeria erythrocarpa]
DRQPDSRRLERGYRQRDTRDRDRDRERYRESDRDSYRDRDEEPRYQRERRDGDRDRERDRNTRRSRSRSRSTDRGDRRDEDTRSDPFAGPQEKNAEPTNAENFPSRPPKEKKQEKNKNETKNKQPKIAPTAEPMIIVNVNDRLGTKAAIPCLASDSIRE